MVSPLNMGESVVFVVSFSKDRDPVDLSTSSRTFLQLLLIMLHCNLILIIFFGRTA